MRQYEPWPSNGIRVVFRCWKDRVVYDESKYLAALARGSSLWLPSLPSRKLCEIPCGFYVYRS
jgi:hypothetical protein